MKTRNRNKSVLTLAVVAMVCFAMTAPANAALITGESVHDFSHEFDAARGAVNAVNESGLTLQSPDVWHHGNSSTAQDMWLSGEGVSNPDPTPWIEIDLGAEFTLTEIHFWNNNESDAGKNRGAELIDVYVSNTPGTAGNNTDDGTWGTSITTLNPGIGPGTADYAGERFDIPDTTGRYVRFDITDNYGDANFGGFSEVHFYVATIPEPTTFALATLGLLGLGFRRRRGTRQR